jgi:putative endonuclease
MNGYTTYVLRSKLDGKFYTGYTSDLEKRLNEHNSGKVYSTKRRVPFELVYYELCINKDDAIHREKYLKTSYFTGLKDQLQRSSISIPSNIAEGDESGTNKISIRYFYTAKGSVAELQTQLIIASEIGYIDSVLKDKLINDCDRISIMLNKIIKARSE